MACTLAQSQHAVQLSGRYPPGDLHDECRGVAQQRHSQGRQKAETVSHRRLRDKSSLPGDPGGVEKVDHASPQLEAGLE